MNDILCRQLAIDYCCSLQDVLDRKNHFTRHEFLENRRRFREQEECFLKIAVVNGKLLFTGNPKIIDWCRLTYNDTGSEWFFEAKNLHELNMHLLRYGYQIVFAHPFFIAETITEISCSNYEIQWYNAEQIEQFRGDGRFDEAYTFCADAPDVIGVSASIDGNIIGMAGASADSPNMWQIGINVDPNQERSGIAKMLVTLLKNEILKKGILPYYGTGMSHLASMRVALGSGFVLTWAELVTSKAEDT